MSNDASLDEELLQITEKKNSSTIKKPPKKARREDSEEEVSGEESDDKKGKKKNKSSESKKPLKKRQKTESEEDKNGYESSDDDDVFHDGYDEDLMGDEEDRERLRQLPELEREHILGERYERRKELKDQWEMKRMLKNNRRSTEKEKEKEREKRDRTKKNKEKKGKALSDLKKMRARLTKDEDDEGEEEEGEERDKDKEDGDYEDEIVVKESRSSRHEKDSYDKSSEEEEDEEAADAMAAKRPFSLEELNSIRLPRESLIQWINKPFFDDLVPGFFVRIGIGPDPTTHTNVYRVAQIDSVKTLATTYNLPGADAPVNKVLVLRIASKGKDCKMDTISNRSFNDAEYKKYMAEMQKVKLQTLTSAEAKDKAKTLRKATNYKYTNADIEKMLAAKRKEGTLPIKLASEKARLSAMRDAVKDTDLAEFVRLSDEITRLEKLSMERHETLNKISKATTIANINQRNKQANFDQTFSESSNQAKQNNDLDPFSRRKTLPRVLLARKGEPGAAPTEDTKHPLPTNGHPNNNQPNSKLLSTSSDKMKDPAKGLHDEHSGVKIDIPVELVNGSSNNPLTTIPRQFSSAAAPLPLATPVVSATYISPASTATPGAQKLSLQDYMRRRKEYEDTPNK